MDHVLLVLDEADLLSDRGMEKLMVFIKWCQELKIDVISVYIGVIQDGMDPRLLEKAYSHLMQHITNALSKEKASLAIYTDSPTPEPPYMKFINGVDDDRKRISISIGLGGRSELTKAIKTIAKRVQIGDIEPEEIDEKVIESELIFKSEPDLVIRSGATRLTDFLLWQSVYSEFYFTDVNWAKFRKIDLLRAVRDFLWRERRFGR